LKVIGEGLRLGRRALYWFLTDLALIAIFVSVYTALTALSPLRGESLEQLLAQYSKYQHFLKSLGLPLYLMIFVNNLGITLASYIPFAGLGIFGYVLYRTARTLQLFSLAVSCATGAPLQFANIVSILALVLLPHTYLEFFAYGTAVYQNARLCRALILRRRDEVRRELVYTGISLVIAVIALLAGAVVEAYIIGLTGVNIHGLPPPSKLETMLRHCLGASG